MPEFDLIRRLEEIVSSSGASSNHGCVLGIGDDAAVLEAPAGKQLVFCVDTLVEGVHFPMGTSARAVGFKSLAVNLSDLAAMGADPAWFLLALTLPEPDSAWLEEFAAGVAELADRTGIMLCGGDTTSGSLNISVTAAGLVEKGQALTRRGAQAGDLVVVSGVPGKAANALRALKEGSQPHADDLQALNFPEPRLALGRALAGRASACIDISDGLLADLGHILKQSGVGARLDLANLPLSPSLSAVEERARWPLQLSGGDDYELCFTLPQEHAAQIPDLARRGGVKLAVLGRVTATEGVTLNKPDGGRYDAATAGYEHFGSQHKTSGEME